MTTTAVIALGILAWTLLAIPIALVVARMMRVRDRQRPGCPASGAPAPGTSPQGISADGAEETRTPPKWRLRNRI